jgi:soluble lytic murein transglycosylase-like protein
MNPWLIGGAVLFLLFLMKPPKALATAIVVTRRAVVQLAAARYGIPERRLYAMIAVESANVPTAKGSAGERGLMQMKPAALADVNRRFKLGITFDDLWDPEKAINAGAAYLRIQVDAFGGNLDLGTQAYNKGAGAVALDKTAGLDYLKKVKAAESTFTNIS